MATASFVPNSTLTSLRGFGTFLHRLINWDRLLPAFIKVGGRAGGDGWVGPAAPTHMNLIRFFDFFSWGFPAIEAFGRS